ncbi:MAG TPA: hypothetical protein DCM57_00555 [Treponema sp.]|nr:hypothetical protein [Treponema sp.]
MLTPMAEEEKKVKSGRKDGAKIGAVIILVISAAVFIPVGGSAVFESIFNKNKPSVFGTYKGRKIEYKAGTEFATAASNLARQYEAYGLDTNQYASSILNSAFENTIKNMFYEDAVKSSGYAVPKEAVNRMILPYFYDESGKYSPKRYNETDESTKTELRTAAEKELVYSRYTDDLFGNDDGSSSRLYGVKSSSKEQAFVAQMGAEKHSFKLAAFSTSTLPSEETVKYGKANSDLFQSYNLSAVTLSSEEDAKALLKQIQNNEITFEDAVAEKSEKFYTDSLGKLSSPYFYQLKLTIPAEEDLNKVTGLANGQLSDVITTERGFSIFRCDGASSAANFNDQATIDTVLAYIQTREVSYIENYYTAKAKDFISDAATTSPATYDTSVGESGQKLDPANPADARKIAAGGENIVVYDGFDQACTKYGVTKVDVPAFPVNYGNSQFMDTVPSEASALSSLSRNADAFKTMFSLKENQTSEPFVLGSNVIVVKCTGITTEDAAEIENYATQAGYYDQDSAGNAILKSPDVTNSFWTAYYDMMMGD